jgi:hypothetical protein
MLKHIWFWRDLYPLVRRFCVEHRVAFNWVVNEAVWVFLGSCDVEELRLKATLAGLLREENELRLYTRVMLRSGSFLPQYATKILREPGRALGYIRSGQIPLKALNPAEEKVFRKVLTRREAIAREVTRVLGELLRDVRPFRLKPDFKRSWSRARGKIKPLNPGEERDG